MNSLKRFGFPLLGGLVAFLMVAGISSAAAVTLADLATAKTFLATEIQFDHDMVNPFQVTITGATWSASDVGDVRLNEISGSLSDLVRFVNVGGVANIYFASDDNGTVPLTGPLSGPSPGSTLTFAETSPASSFTKTLTTTDGSTVKAVITSDSELQGPGAPSDHITLSATIPQVPEPSTFTLAGLGALGLLIRSYRRRRT